MQTILVRGQSVSPSKIVCVGRNYAGHIEELGNETPAEMVVFIKPNSAISDILRSQIAETPLHFESELCFLVMAGRLGAVAFGLDLTKRDLQSTLKCKGLPWERAKAFDGSALFSQFVALPTDPTGLALQLRVDGELRQAGGVDMMIYPPNSIVEEISRFMTLEDGDVIMTGTPAGVRRVHTGERFEGSVLAGGEVLVDVAWVAQ